jgi:hypothetical protein
MQLALQIKEQKGYNEIYLATDDKDIFSQLHPWQNDFKFYYQELPSFSKGDYRWNQQTPKELTNVLLLDLELLSECNVFVGAQRSMFGWLATR